MTNLKTVLLIFLAIIVLAVIFTFWIRLNRTTETTFTISDETALLNLVKENLRGEYQPKSFNLILTSNSSTFTTYSATWSKQKDTIQFSTDITYDYLAGVKRFSLYTKYQNMTNLDNETAKSIHEKFFKPVSVLWSCRKEINDTLIICESYANQKVNSVTKLPDNQTFVGIYLISNLS